MPEDLDIIYVSLPLPGGPLTVPVISLPSRPSATFRTTPARGWWRT